jgi:hypothetical protein
MEQKKESLLPSEGVHFEDEDHGPSEEEDEDHSMVSEAEIDKEWDEGGPSHCGYSEGVHDTLMTVGKSVHKVIGDPPSSVENGIMKQIGNWFQEMSYAVRDIVRGKDDVHDDISKAASTMKDDALASVFGSAPRENDESFT